ncbi:MAG: sodium:calcium antiporter [Acidimicrobiales bacterium]
MSSLGAAWATLPVAALLSLAASAVLVVRIERVAARLRFREALLGLVAALAADGPEISSAVTAMIRGQRAIGVGVVLGSNVFNIAALLGLSTLRAGRIRLHRDVIVLAGAASGAIALVSVGTATGVLAPGLGLGLGAAAFVPYVVLSALGPRAVARLPVADGRGGRLARAVSDEEAELSAALRPRPGGAVDGLVAGAALAVVIGAAAVMEAAAGTIGARYRVPEIVIGGLLLAAVTSLPNAVAAWYLAGRGRSSAVLSVALNSNSLNVLFGLLGPAVLVGLAGYGTTGVLVASWYAAMTAAALVLAYRGRGLGRLSGAALVLGYLAFVVVVARR